MWVCDTRLRKEEPAWAVLLCVHSKCPPDGWHVTARERVSWRGEMEDVLVVKVSCCFLIYLRLLLIRTFLDTPHLRGIVNTSLLHLGLSRLLFPSKFCIRIQKKDFCEPGLPSFFSGWVRIDKWLPDFCGWRPSFLRGGQGCASESYWDKSL